MEQLLTSARYLPFLTTIIALLLARAILARWLTKDSAAPHLWWWGIGMLVFAAGNTFEALVTICGWNVLFFKSWYILGALSGGAPLALGTIYLLGGRKAGAYATVAAMSALAITSTLVIMSPIDQTAIQQGLLTSDVLGWSWIRDIALLINGFASVVLIGGAAFSAGHYSGHPYTRNRFLGNMLIAAGASFPAIGGMCCRYGLNGILNVANLAGLSMIWAGYRLCLRPQEVSRAVIKRMVFDKPPF